MITKKIGREECSITHTLAMEVNISATKKSANVIACYENKKKI